MNTKKPLSKRPALIAGATASLFLLAGATAFAASPTPPSTMIKNWANTAHSYLNRTATSTPAFTGKPGQGMPDIIGTVSAVNGDSITIVAQPFGFRKGATTTPPTSDQVAKTYIINISSATKVTKAGTAIQPTGIAVGDTLFVQGTVADNTVAASIVTDGFDDMARVADDKNKNASQSPWGTPKGNFVAGKITAVDGTSFTILEQAHPTMMPMHRGSATSTPATSTTLAPTPVSITVDTTSSTVFKDNGATTTASTLAVGQNVIVTGTDDATTHTVSAATAVNIVTLPIQNGANGGVRPPMHRPMQPASAPTASVSSAATSQ